MVPTKANSIEELVDDFILNEMNTPKECEHDFSDGTGTGYYVCKKCGILNLIDMNKCNYCGKTEVCEGTYPEGCFLENDVAKQNEEAKEYFKSYCIARGIMGVNEATVFRWDEVINIMIGFHDFKTKSNCEVKITSINNVCQHANLEELQLGFSKCKDCGYIYDNIHKI